LLFVGILGKKDRIIGGSTAFISDFPHMVSIRLMPANQIICGGSIITKWNILTAAHCLALFQDYYDNVRIYTGSASSVNIEGNNFEVETAIFHPEFAKTININGVLPNNVGIIKV
jgi:secreted trypsin-like serine protease